MNKVVFLVYLAVLLVDSAVEGQLMCFQGTRSTNGGFTSGSFTSSQCPSGTAACHIFDFSITTRGQTGMPL